MVSKTLVFVALVFSAAVGFAKPKAKMKNEKFEVAGVGSVRVVHDVLGEPVGQPERLQVFLKCFNSKREIRFKVYRMCQWEAFEYDAGIKTLILKVTRGRVDPKAGTVICNLIDREEIDFTDVCKSNK